MFNMLKCEDNAQLTNGPTNNSLALPWVAYTDLASQIHKIDLESIKFSRKASKTTKRHYEPQTSKTKLKSWVKQGKAQV